MVYIREAGRRFLHRTEIVCNRSEAAGSRIHYECKAYRETISDPGHATEEETLFVAEARRGL